MAATNRRMSMIRRESVEVNRGRVEFQIVDKAIAGNS